MNIEQERARVLGLLSGITPGEWRTDNDDGSSGFLFALNERGVNRMAASVTRGQDDFGERASLEESHANSELMAAAPTLARDYAEALAEIERLREALGQASAIVGQVERAQREPGVEGQRARWVFGPAAQVAEVIRAALASAPEERP